ncbi:hypothetical protein [Streptomyces sp. NPDC050564]|uniref:hypothetical protein n=1 Tax=Streptomyces sp. NPDC050564 TaxID=3365631 RepID=UPI003787E5B9
MPRYTQQQRSAIAADHDRWADEKQKIADRLTAEGKTVAAGTLQRAADERREVAAAARESSDALNDLLDPL